MVRASHQSLAMHPELITRSIFYAGYLAAQLPATYVMKKVPIGKFISGTIIAWSIVLTLHAAVTSYEGLLACRFLLGL